MAEREVYIGSEGPLLYDDADEYDDGVKHSGLRTNGYVRASVVETAGLECDGIATTFLRLIGLDEDPPSPADGQMWYRSDLNEIRMRHNNKTYVLVLAEV